MKVLNYGFCLYQNTIYMADRTLVEQTPELKINQNSNCIFKKGFPKKEILRTLKDFSGKHNDWYFKTFQNGQYAGYLNKYSKINVLNKIIQIQLTFEKGKFCPQDGEEILILDRFSYQLLGTIQIVHFKEGTFVGLVYSRFLTNNELVPFKTQFKTGPNMVQSENEMESYILELVQETPRLTEVCPWLLDKDKSQIPN
jgi:hypothetical protein